MSQNVYVNLKSLKTSVSGSRQTAFDKLSTAFGKYSKTGNDNKQADKTTKFASRMNMLRVAVKDYLDPTAGMTDEQKERFIKKLYAKIQSGKKLTPDEMQYLRQNDPVTYMKVARVQAQREAFETYHINDNQVKNTSKGFWSIALFGIDTRIGEENQSGVRSDSIMVPMS